MLEQNNNKIVFNIDDNLNCKKIVFNIDEIIKNNPHYKGYIYDSLMYRYIRAREAMAEYEYLRDKQSNISNHTEWAMYRQRANSDMMRFSQILNEAIGEHD